MDIVDDLEAAVRRLSPGQRQELLRRIRFIQDRDGNHGFVDQDGNDEWDRQMVADAHAGKFDEMIARVDADIAAGRLRPLP